eukprot:1161207-Pelagomonas_calceolata.AAC.1
MSASPPPCGLSLSCAAVVHVSIVAAALPLIYPFSDAFVASLECPNLARYQIKITWLNADPESSLKPVASLAQGMGGAGPPHTAATPPSSAGGHAQCDGATTPLSKGHLGAHELSEGGNTPVLFPGKQSMQQSSFDGEEDGRPGSSLQAEEEEEEEEQVLGEAHPGLKPQPLIHGALQ